MNIYLAAAWSKREEMQKLATDLEKTIPGLIVNSRWIKEARSNNRWSPATNARMNCEPKNMEKAVRRLRAEQDREDVEAADILIRFTDDLSKKMVPSYLATGSRMWEMGYAMRGHQPVIIVGGIQNFFDYLPEVQHVKNVDALKRTLRRMQRASESNAKEGAKIFKRILKRHYAACRKIDQLARGLQEA